MSRLLRRAIALKLFGQLWTLHHSVKGHIRYAAKDGTGGNGQNWAVRSVPLWDSAHPDLYVLEWSKPDAQKFSGDPVESWVPPSRE